MSESQSRRVSISREVAIPDHLKVERYRRAPEVGPRILFFSGGTALRDASRELIRYTHNSVHIITPFDSGGSSAVLREAFGMPAVGDIRNRLMALSDQTVHGNPEIYRLFTYRLSAEEDNADLEAELDDMASGRHRYVRTIPDPMRKIILNHFKDFMESIPEDFDLRGASVGNLILAAGYLANRRQMDPVVYLFSRLVQVCGTVTPVVNRDLHLAARLRGGRVVVGQHLLTGKETGPLEEPVESLWLTESLNSEGLTEAVADKSVLDALSEAELICYPVGSFYTSVVANLLPRGVGRAIAANPCPKVFVPNTGHDPEALGMSVADQVKNLGEYVRADGVNGQAIPDLVIVDTRRGDYRTPFDATEVEKLGAKVVDCELVSDESAPLIDGRRLCEVLLSLT